MKNFYSTLYGRLVLSHLLVSLISITLISAFAGRSIFASAQEDVQYNLEDLAFATSNSIEYPLQEVLSKQVQPSYLRAAILHLFPDNPQQYHFTIFDSTGAPIVDTGDSLPPQADSNSAPEVIEAFNSDIGKGMDIRRDSQGQEMMYVAVQIQIEENLAGILRMGAPLQPALVPARRTFGLLLLVSLMVATGVSWFGWRLANTLARPIQELTETAGLLARSDLQARVKPAGTVEMRRLAQAFNIMADRIQDHINELRAFVANASHELRTALTVVKLRAEALRNGALEDPKVAEQFLAEIETEVDRLVVMVNDLLDLSRIEAGLISSQHTPLNMGVLANEVYESFSLRAERAEIKFSLDVEPGLPAVVGNEDQLRRVLYNLVDNAIKFTPCDGEVDLLLRSGYESKSVRLLVRDTGQGVSPEHLPHIFERFYRADTTRPRTGGTKGSGLGLAIAKTIVENHGGKIGVSSQIGRGTTFWAELPADGSGPLQDGNLTA